MRLAPRTSNLLALRLPRIQPWSALYLLLLAGLAWPFLFKQVSEWDIVYVPTAAHLLAGEDIYAQSHGYVYPPLQSLLAAPVLGLPPFGQKLALFILNAVALWVAIRSAWRIAGGPDLDRAGWREHVACGLGLCIGMSYFLNSLMHHQTDVLLAGLLFAGIERLDRGRGLLGAGLLGLAAAMKCTPLLFALYLIVRGRFLAAGALVGAAIAASLLPDLIHGPADASTWLGKWWSLYLAPMAASDHRPGIWASEVIYNQSLLGAFNRWTMTAWSLGESFQVEMIEPLAGPRALKIAILTSALVLGGLSFYSMRAARSLPAPVRTAWESSLVICGMLLFSPMSSPAHFGVLLLPAFLLARSALLGNSRITAALLAVLLAAAYAANKDLLGANLYPLGLWHGSAMFAALVTLIGCWREMQRSSGA